MKDWLAEIIDIILAVLFVIFAIAFAFLLIVCMIVGTVYLVRLIM